jgi:hypothetical protein
LSWWISAQVWIISKLIGRKVIYRMIRVDIIRNVQYKSADWKNILYDEGVICRTWLEGRWYPAWLVWISVQGRWRHMLGRLLHLEKNTFTAEEFLFINFQRIYFVLLFNSTFSGKIFIFHHYQVISSSFKYRIFSLSAALILFFKCFCF